MGVKRLTFVKTCSTGGVSERLVLPANEIRTRSFIVQAKETNTGFVRIGYSDVSLTNGIYLEAKDYARFSNIEHQDTEAESNLSDTWIICETGGEGVVVSYDDGENLDF